jgi:hypothetical protein
VSLRSVGAAAFALVTLVKVVEDGGSFLLVGLGRVGSGKGFVEGVFDGDFDLGTAG